jgi:hypothetical protein
MQPEWKKSDGLVRIFDGIGVEQTRRGFARTLPNWRCGWQLGKYRFDATGSVSIPGR